MVLVLVVFFSFHLYTSTGGNSFDEAGGRFRTIEAPATLRPGTRPSESLERWGSISSQMILGRQFLTLSVGLITFPICLWSIVERLIRVVVDVVPSRKLTYPTLGKRKSSSKVPSRGYVGSLEGNSSMIACNVWCLFVCLFVLFCFVLFCFVLFRLFGLVYLDLFICLFAVCLQLFFPHEAFLVRLVAKSPYWTTRW